MRWRPFQDLHECGLARERDPGFVPMDAVVGACAGSLGRTGKGLTTSLGVLLAPPSPLVPEQLHGRKAVHLSPASTTGAQEAAVLREALAAAPPPPWTRGGR